MEELRLEANGLGFRCLSAGDPARPLVLLLHGFPEGAESWDPQLRALAAAGLWAVAPDLRGYGGTDCPSGEDAYRISELVADVEGLLQAVGRTTCHLAGHDWGAMIGWSFSSRHPERLSSWSALSVGHPAALSQAMRDDPDQRQRSSYMQLFRQAGKAEEVLSAHDHARLRAIYTMAPVSDAIPEAVIERYVRGLGRPGRLTAALNYYRANLGGPGPPPAGAGVMIPSQLIWGEDDPALGRLSVELTANFVAGEYRLRVLRGAGHWLQFERPEQVSSLLVEWVEAH